MAEAAILRVACILFDYLMCENNDQDSQLFCERVMGDEELPESSVNFYNGLFSSTPPLFRQTIKCAFKGAVLIGSYLSYLSWSAR